MALGTNRVSAMASPGMAAAATARPASGGRNVASVSGPAEGAGFSPQIGVNDNRLLRYDDEFSFDSKDQQQQQKQWGTPFIVQAATGFQVEMNEGTTNDNMAAFRDYITRSLATYEQNMRVTTPGAVRPGSVMNYLF